MPEIAGILLAAGRGERFDRPGNKLLAPLADGRPVGVAALSNMRAAGIEVYAVVAAPDDRLAASLASQAVRLVVNPDAGNGMGSSLACGIAAAAHAQAWVVGLADMPWIRSSTVRAVIDALRGGAVLAAPRYRGRRGHPVGFGTPFRAALLALGGRSGARALLEQHRAELKLVDVDDPGILVDIDTPGDLDAPPG
ncbi:MAG: nucleotidyltransferase family protein [Gammaproteobacteria bacterium]